ncbi:uncharacterized protein LOC119077589 [Bradysia coprophila]|uniref:uncharacterized protein LOC119077589 n=1 Tax=Bradysia coprophila TaxID=38358 RepID=UPI00187DA14E|nr:uncharacterized protein LOC119077589 [Bradysia coprophila]
MENNNNRPFESDFDEQNFTHDNQTNGTTKEIFDRRSDIDRKNLDETYVRSGITWDTYGECKVCSKECRRRCEKCPWIFYCCREHQLEHWPDHKKNCKYIDWGEDGIARAGKDLAEGTVILEKSTIFVSPRYHTEAEANLLTSDDYAQSDGILRPCFGCHMLIPPYFNETFVCHICKFPIHNAACAASPWHVAECQILKRIHIRSWYKDIGSSKDVMLRLAVLRGVLLKNRNSTVWTKIMSLESDSIYLLAEDLKQSILCFVLDVCKVEGVDEDDVVKFLTIFVKQRLNCTLPCNTNKRLVSVLCSGIIPFTLVNDQNANIQGGIIDYRMRMAFRTVKPVQKGDILTIGRGGS